jgi:hypothetical protein
MPTDLRLPCLFPRCPVRFKSQHGRTYHIRAVHTNSNAQVGPNQAQADSEIGDDNHSLDLTERRVRVARRIEHPHLTGVCSVLTSCAHQ